MNQKYLDIKFSADNLNKIDTINDVLSDYMSQGFVLTLRQLYYQLVKAIIIPNNQKEYKKLSELLKNGRMAGLIDWSAIEDRGRVPKLPYAVDGIADALSDTLEQYRLDRMKTQNRYVEVWIEKDALASVFLRVTQKYHIRLMVNKGYSSCSAMNDAATRFKYQSIINKKETGVILYFGDHDASGLDMVRDIQNRMGEFNADVTVLHPALNMDQVETFDLPENPAKITDPRAAWYIDTYGYSSWELDGLQPFDLMEICETAVQSIIDIPAFNKMVKKENADIKELTKIIESHK